VLLFFIGLALVIVEMFVFPGTIFIGIAGAALMLVSIVLAFIDAYPNPGPGPGLPIIPNFGDQLQVRAWDLLYSLVGGVVAIWLLSRILPKTPMYHTLISHTASGMNTEAHLEAQKVSRQGQDGVTISPLHPGGKAQFGDEIMDVVSQGERVDKGVRVRIIGSRGSDALVEVID